MKKIVIVPNDLDSLVTAVDETAAISETISELTHKIDTLNQKLIGLKETVDYLSDSIIDIYNLLDTLTARVDKCCGKE